MKHLKVFENKTLKNNDFLEKIDDSLLNFLKQLIPDNMEVSLALFRENMLSYSTNTIKIVYTIKNVISKSSFLHPLIKKKLIEKYPSLNIRGTQDNQDNKNTIIQGDLRILYKPIYREINKFNL